MAHQAQNEYYPDREGLAMDYATCVNQEVKELFAAGADVVQLDEPWLRNNVQEAKEYAVPFYAGSDYGRSDSWPQVLKIALHSVGETYRRSRPQTLPLSTKSRRSPNWDQIGTI